MILPSDADLIEEGRLTPDPYYHEETYIIHDGMVEKGNIPTEWRQSPITNVELRKSNCVVFTVGMRTGKKLISAAIEKLIVADDYIKKLDEGLEKVRKASDILPDADKILEELSIIEEPIKIREGKHKKKNKSFKNWEHREFWRG